MDMYSRTQYLKRLQERYFQARSKKEKSSILDEYCKNTNQNRKYVISRINSSFSSKPRKRKKRKCIYDGYVKAALAKVWDIFDEPCGQRLAPLLKTEVDRLRQLEEIFVCNEVAEKLKRISPRTIDRALKRQKETLHLSRKYSRKRNPLIYQRIPVKAGGWDRSLPGQVQIDLVEQKNSTHIRAVIGHLRYDTEKELVLINSLYRNELRLYKNFFQPVMKLKEKIRDKGKVHRKYDTPKTPYQRLMESEHIPEETKDKLTKIYLSLNPAELKRGIDKKVHMLFKAYEEQNRGTEANPSKKQTPRLETKSYIFNGRTTSASVT